MLKTLLIGTAALATVSTPVAASARPYDGWRGEHAYHNHDAAGAAIAAGLFGLVLGAAIASSSHHHDYDRDYGYRDYGYGGYQDYGDYRPYPVRCDWETRAYPGPWGSVSYQQVQVCR